MKSWYVFSEVRADPKVNRIQSVDYYHKTMFLLRLDSSSEFPGQEVF